MTFRRGKGDRAGAFCVGGVAPPRHRQIIRRPNHGFLALWFVQSSHYTRPTAAADTQSDRANQVAPKVLRHAALVVFCGLLSPAQSITLKKAQYRGALIVHGWAYIDATAAHHIDEKPITRAQSLRTQSQSSYLSSSHHTIACMYTLGS